MSTPAPVAVLGAGIAGLVAAQRLRRHGVAVQVFEGQSQVAGMARTTNDPDGFSYDLGGHFITNRLAAALGAAADCRVVKHYGEAVVVDNARARGYPAGLLRRPRYLAGAVRSRLRAAGSVVDAESWFRHEYGSALADDIAIPLLEAWSGEPANRLSAAVGAKLPASVGQTAWLHAARHLTHRAVAIGYCGAQPQTAGVYHVYPVNGVGALCQGIADSLGDDLHLDAKVDRIFVEDGRSVGVRVNGSEVEASAVISTAPINVLPRLVSGTDVLDDYLSFRFRPMVMVNLKLRGRGLIPETLTWVPRGRPYFRLTEAAQSMPWLAPEGKTMVLAEIGAAVGDHHWAMDDQALVDLTLDHLEDSGVIGDARARHLGGRVVRTPLAYPVFLNEYEPHRQRLASGTGIDGLFSIGRNGEFDHILMEDIYWRTIERMDRWATATRARTGGRVELVSR